MHGGTHLDVIQASDTVGAQVHDLQAAAGGQLRRQRAQLVVPQPQLRQRRAARQVGGPQLGQLQPAFLKVASV